MGVLPYDNTHTTVHTVCAQYFPVLCVPYSGKISRKNILRFRGINFAICVLIVRVCALILTISRINFHELDRITKNAKF